MRAFGLVLLLLVGCASPAASESFTTAEARPSPTPSPTPYPTPSPTPSPTLSPTPSTAGTGSVSYAVTGDYNTIGALPFIPASSFLDQDGTSQLTFCSGTCTHEDSSTFLILGPTFGSDVRFENGEFMLNVACEFTFTRQDEFGLAGQFTCPPDQAFVPGTAGVCAWIAYLDGTVVVSRTDSCSLVGTAAISGTFDARIQ